MSETEPEDDEQAARELLDKEAEFVGGIWAARWPSGKDWVAPE